MSLQPEEYFDYALGYLDTLFRSHKEKEHKKPEDLFFLSHLMEIYDLAADAKTLLNSKSCTSFPIIFRTIFEIFLNIRIVDADPSKYDKLRYEYLKQVIKDLSVKLNPKNGLLSNTSQEIRQALSKRKKEATLEFNELRSRNVCEFKIEEKFEIGGYPKFYEFFYGKMSSYLHGNLLVMEERHIEQISERRFRLLYLQEPSDSEMTRSWLLVTNVLFESGKIARKCLEIRQIDIEFDSRFDEFSAKFGGNE